MTPQPLRCPKPFHEHEYATNCRICISDRLERTTQEAALIRQNVPTERVRAILDAALPRKSDPEGSAA